MTDPEQPAPEATPAELIPPTLPEWDPLPPVVPPPDPDPDPEPGEPVDYSEEDAKRPPPNE